MSLWDFFWGGGVDCWKKTFLQVRWQSSSNRKLKQESKQTTVFKMLCKFRSSSTSDIFCTSWQHTYCIRRVVNAWNDGGGNEIVMTAGKVLFVLQTLSFCHRLLISQLLARELSQFSSTTTLCLTAASVPGQTGWCYNVNLFSWFDNVVAASSGCTGNRLLKRVLLLFCIVLFHFYFFLNFGSCGKLSWLNCQLSSAH